MSYNEIEMPSSKQTTRSDRTWFLLVDTYGEPYKETTASSVSVSPATTIDQFLDAVHRENSSLLRGIASSQLFAYKNKTDFDGKEDPLPSSSPLNGYGKSEGDSLIVVVPHNAQVIATIPPIFIEYLNLGGIYRPEEHVLVRIAHRYSEQLQAVLDIGLPELCVDLYATVKDLPSAYILNAIRKHMNLSMNLKPVSLMEPNIFNAIDLGLEYPFHDIIPRVWMFPQVCGSR